MKIGSNRSYLNFFLPNTSLDTVFTHDLELGFCPRISSHLLAAFSPL